MNRHALLIDFGASRIKSALISLDDGTIRTSHFSPGSSAAGAKMPASFFANALTEHLSYSNAKAKLDAILICCEMHGFVRATNATGNEREYVSWRHSSDRDNDIIEKLKSLNYQHATGMRPRRGLPAITMLAENGMGMGEVFADTTISFLPDEICRQLGHSNNLVHASLAHASGLFTRTNEPLAIFGLDDFRWPSASTDDLPEIGHVRFEDQNIPCFGGYGDLQASVFGMSPDPEHWIINLGTGSQLISLEPTHAEEFEIRKYFGDQTISCVTHIPAGRALNMFADFFKDIRQDKSVDYFWNMLSSATPTLTSEQKPAFNLAFFPEAFAYDGGGYIEAIQEDSFGVQNFFNGLLDSFLSQYLNLLLMEDPQMTRPLLIAGNMASKMPNIQEWFEGKWTASVDVRPETLDPTLACMAKISADTLKDRL